MEATDGPKRPAESSKELQRRLVARAQTGDLDAFDALVRQYEKQVYNLAYRMTGNYDDANDVAAEAFVRVFNAISRFRGESSFTTWLYRIVTNVFLDERKRRRNHPVVSLEDEYESEGAAVQRQIEDESPGPLALAELSERKRVLNRAISLLPDFQRDIIAMFHVMNLSYEEIAEVTGTPIGTVKSRLNRARMALRDILAAQEEVFRS